jgi:hypothetical protein
VAILWQALGVVRQHPVWLVGCCVPAWTVWVVNHFTGGRLAAWADERLGRRVANAKLREGCRLAAHYVLHPIAGPLTVIGLFLLSVMAQEPPPPAPPVRRIEGQQGMVGLRAQMKRLRQAQAHKLADEIGPPPGDCPVDVGHIRADELGEGIAQHIAEIFQFAGWKVEVTPHEPTTSAAPGVLIEFSPATAIAAGKLQTALNQLEHTAIAPRSTNDAPGCGLRITVGPQ